MRASIGGGAFVALFYATAMSTQDGETRLYPDMYGYDDQLVRLLAGGFPYNIDPTNIRAH